MPASAPAHGRKVGVFPGQFDPITLGHLDVISRAAKLFDILYVAVGINPEKREFFSVPERVEMIRGLVSAMPGVSVESYSGLTVDFVRKVGATALLRGIRDVSDLRYEFQLAQANRIVGNVETVFVMAGGPVCDDEQFADPANFLTRRRYPVIVIGATARRG